LGELKKVNIEHDNSGLRKHWLVDRVEVMDPQTNRTVVFPCNKWLSKVKEDGEIQRDLFPLVEERPMSRSSMTKSPRNSFRDFEKELEKDYSMSFNRRGRDLNLPNGNRREFEREIGMSPGRSKERELDRDIFRGSRREFERDNFKVDQRGGGFGEARGSARSFERELFRR